MLCFIWFTLSNLLHTSSTIQHHWGFVDLLMGKVTSYPIQSARSLTQKETERHVEFTIVKIKLVFLYRSPVALADPGVSRRVRQYIGEGASLLFGQFFSRKTAWIGCLDDYFFVANESHYQDLSGNLFHQSAILWKTLGRNCFLLLLTLLIPQNNTTCFNSSFPHCDFSCQVILCLICVFSQ